MFTRRHVITLEPTPESAHSARRFFADVAKRHRLTPEQIRRGELAVSELVTNAVTHAPGPIRLAARHTRGGVRLEVTDCNPRPPHMGEPTIERPGSRGLPIVAATVTEWGWESDRDEQGKRVWFVVTNGATSAPTAGSHSLMSDICRAAR